MADEATLRIVVQDASVGQSPPPDDAPPLTPYQSAPTPSFSQQAPPANAYQSQPPVSTPRAAPRPSSPADDPYEQARRLRESQIQREQVKAAYDQMYGTAEKANSIFDGVLDAAQKMRGTLGGVFGPLVGALLDIYAATREAKREDGNAIRAEAERRNLLKPEMVFQRQADVAIQQKRQEETTPTSVGPIQSDTIMAEAREALLALGNSQIEADKLLRQVMDNANATFATVQDVIRAAYQNKGASAASATQPQAASTPMPASTTPVPTPPPIKKASGGEVPIVGGIPASADEVPIKATAGEFVVRKDEAQKPANKSMLQAMNSGMDVASHFATGGEIPQIDPFEKHFDVLKSEAMGFPGEQKWKHVPHDAELFAAGAEAQVFRQPNADEIYRVQSNSGYGDPIDYRPNIEPLLQPTAQKKLDDNGRTSLVERMPFAPNFPQVMMTMPEPTRFEDTPSQIWEGVVTDIKQRLDDSGYEYRDLNPRNVGFRDGKWYIVDPGGLKKKSGDGEIQSRNRLPHFAAGGVIPPSPNVSPHSDNVPILAKAGEYVVRQDAASRPENRQALDNMNRGAAPTPQAQPDMIDLIMKSIVNPMIGVREMEPWSLESTQLRVLSSVDALKASRENQTPNAPNMPSVPSPNVSPASDNPISIVPSSNVAPRSSANAIPVARTATAGIARGPLPVAATATTANAAGMAGMAAKAVPVLGTVVVVAEALAKVFGALNSAVNETVTKYADLNPAVAQAQARAEMTATFNDMRRANDSAPQLTRYIEVQSRLQQKYEDVKIAILKRFIDIVAPIMDLIEKVAPSVQIIEYLMDQSLSTLRAISDFVEWIVSWLPAQAQTTTSDPVDLILNQPQQIQLPPNAGL